MCNKSTANLKQNIFILYFINMKQVKHIFSSITFVTILSFVLLPFQGVFAAAYLTLESFSGPPTTVVAKGGGYTPGETISLYVGSVGNTPAGTATAGEDSFWGPVNLNLPPNTPQGSVTITAVGTINTDPQTNSYYVVPFNPSITMTGNDTPGSILTITGQGYAPDESVRFEINGQEVGTVNTDATGSFNDGNATIPSLVVGNYELHAVGQSSGAKAIGYLYVGTFYPSVTPSTYYLLPTQVLNFSGSGFAANETIRVFEGQNQTALASFSAEADGSFTSQGNLTMPLSFAGTKVFKLVGLTSGGTAQIEVTVGNFNPYVSPSSYYLLPGEVLTFSGGGFATNETVEIFAGKTKVSQFTTDEKGNFSAAGSYVIPFDWLNSSRTFRLVGQTGGGSADVTLTVGQFNSLVSPSAYFLMAGDDISFSGNGFSSGETIVIHEGSNPELLSTITTDQNGNFTNSGTITIPFNWANSSRTFYFTAENSRTEAQVIITVSEFSPQVSPSSYYVLPGDTITFNGSGFGKGEKINVTEGNNNTVLSTITADDTGAFTENGAFYIPYDWSNKRTLHLRGLSSNALSHVDITIASFNPSLVPSTYYVLPGRTVTISGNGFAANEEVEVKMNGGSPIAIMTTSTGGFQDAGPFTAPFSGNSILFEVRGKTSGVNSSLNITLGTLSPVVELDNYYAQPGTTINVLATGFGSNETLTIKLGSATTQATTNSEGTASSTPITIPLDVNGPMVNVTISGNTSGVSGSTSLTLAPFAPQLEPSTWYTTPGTTVTFTGSGFSGNETVNIQLNNANVGTATTNANGGFTSEAITIPYNASSAHFTFNGQSSHANASIDISLAGFIHQVEPSTWYTPAGSNVTFTGSGFANGETITITLNNNEVGTVTVNGEGGFTTNAIIIPYGTNAANFKFVGSSSGANVSIPITIAELSAAVVLSTYYANGGSPLTVTGMGFGSNENVAITFGGQNLGTATANGNGDFTLETTVPYLTAGDKSVQAKGENSNAIATTNFTMPTVYVSLELGSYAGASGSNVNFIGSGYLPSEPIQVMTDRTGENVVHNFSSDASGNFNNSGYTVPTDFVEGPLNITVKGEHGLTPINITYYVTGG